MHGIRHSVSSKLAISESVVFAIFVFLIRIFIQKENVILPSLLMLGYKIENIKWLDSISILWFLFEWKTAHLPVLKEEIKLSKCALYVLSIYPTHTVP